MIKLETTTAYDVPEVSERLGLCVTTVRKYLREGRIKAQKVGRKYYVTEETLKEFLNGDARSDDTKAN